MSGLGMFLSSPPQPFRTKVQPHDIHNNLTTYGKGKLNNH